MVNTAAGIIEVDLVFAGELGDQFAVSTGVACVLYATL